MWVQKISSESAVKRQKAFPPVPLTPQRTEKRSGSGSAAFLFSGLDGLNVKRSQIFHFRIFTTHVIMENVTTWQFVTPWLVLKIKGSVNR